MRQNTPSSRDNFFIKTLFISKKVVLYCLLGYVFLAIPAGISAQESNEAVKETSASSGDPIEVSDSPFNIVEEGAMFQFDALGKVRNYIKKTKQNIKRLYILVENYGDDVPDTKEGYVKLKKVYNKALVYYYQKKYTLSLKLHRANHELINNLYKKFVLNYKKDTLKLLEVAAEKLVDSEEQELNGGPDSYKAKGELINLQNSFKLRTAYNQFARAEYMELNNLQPQAITHYRLAKAYAIRVLHNLSDNDKSKQEIETKYKKDLYDAQGRIAK